MEMVPLPPTAHTGPTLQRRVVASAAAAPPATDEFWADANISFPSSAYPQPSQQRYRENGGYSGQSTPSKRRGLLGADPDAFMMPAAAMQPQQPMMYSSKKESGPPSFSDDSDQE